MQARGQTRDQSRKDFNKIVDGLAKLEPARDKAGEAFKKSLEEYNTVQLAWVEEQILACKEFEDSEVDRINFLKGLMSEYATEGKNLSVSALSSRPRTDAALRCAALLWSHPIFDGVEGYSVVCEII